MSVADDCMATVSYTHLDVYKRQELQSSISSNTEKHILPHKEKKPMDIKAQTYKLIDDLKAVCHN